MKKDLTMFGYVLRFAAVFVIATLLAACGKSNSAGPQMSTENKHPADWGSAHRVAYRQTPDLCRGCHGIDLKGGVTNIDCFNQAGLGQCHAGTPPHGPRQVAHALPFTDPALHGTMAKKDLIFCQDCHGEPGATGGSGAGSNPRFTKPIGSLATGCEATGCHPANMVHPPKPWKGHRDSGNLRNACALCHGASLEGSVDINSPACNKCHTQLIAGAGSVPVAGQCVSCHGNPPNTGSHVVHLALGGMSGNCIACHAGKGTGTPNHGTGTVVPLTIASNFNTNSGASYDVTAKTCANVSCHGGQTTPVWGGSLDVVNNCETCHKQAPATGYISYKPGSHSYHIVDKGIPCWHCHDLSVMGVPSMHFKDVTTNSTNSSAFFETLPSSTLYKEFINYNATQSSCTIDGNKTPAGVATNFCHPGLVRIWNPTP